MRIKVNRTWVEVYDGASVRQAVLRYIVQRKLSTILLNRCKVYDQHGHPIDMDAPLEPDQYIKVR